MEKAQIKLEVQHIFDSGANELRFVELIEKLIDRSFNKGYNEGWRDAEKEEIKRKL